MGTTLTLMKVKAAAASSVTCGDSRGYLVRDGAVRRLTTDHSVVEELVRTGTLSGREALEHPQRKLLTRALGADPDVQVDLVTEPLMAGDRLLLCTDGLTAVVLDHELGEILTEEAEPEKAAARLVQIANAGEGPIISRGRTRTASAVTAAYTPLCLARTPAVLLAGAGIVAAVFPEARAGGAAAVYLLAWLVAGTDGGRSADS